MRYYNDYDCKSKRFFRKLMQENDFLKERIENTFFMTEQKRAEQGLVDVLGKIPTIWIGTLDAADAEYFSDEIDYDRLSIICYAYSCR